jgi:acyl dehydratase
VRYWEDFAAGQVYELGSYEMTREEIIEFGRRWDPQPFHVDEQAAAASAFGGLIASGWHTGCVLMRLYVDGLLHDAASMGSPGLDELRWLAPVRPGDVLTVTLHVLDVTESSKRPDRGTVHLRWEVTTVDGVPVARATGRGMFGRRVPAAPAAG